MNGFFIFIFGILIGIVEGRRFLPRLSQRSNALHTPSNSDIPMNATVYWFTVPIDHFAYANDKTFKIKVEINLDKYKDGGPIFFYCGNEGGIVGFMTNTGLMWDLADHFGAALIFAEHRYYGDSQPFGSDSYKDVSNMAYLTSEQALADYAQLLIQLKSGESGKDGLPTFKNNPKVILFGGSYGGMLAAWFRMKYPHLSVGAWASSAPLKYFNGGGVDWGAFDAVTTRTFKDAGANPDNVQNGWTALQNLSNNADGQKFLNNLYQINENSTIKDSTGGENLIGYVREAIEYMAMVDYPYATNFLEPMPGFPVSKAAKFLSGTDQYTDEQLATMLFNVSKIYYNYLDLSNYTACIDPDVCGDPGTAQLGDEFGWPWQECTEIVIEQCARQNTSFFLEECKADPYGVLVDYCTATFQSKNWVKGMMRENAIRDLYGLEISAYSNMILTQGHLDPWSVGGYKDTDPGVNGKNGIYVVEIPGSAHHLDLRTPNTCDGNPIHNLRFQAVKIMECWLKDGCTNPVLRKLPPLNDISAIECKDIINGYPWRQSEPPTGSSAKSLVWLPIFIFIFRFL